MPRRSCRARLARKTSSPRCTTALGRGDGSVALGALLGSDVLAIGPDAADTADGRDATLALLAHDGAAGRSRASRPRTRRSGTTAKLRVDRRGARAHAADRPRPPLRDVARRGARRERPLGDRRAHVGGRRPERPRSRLARDNRLPVPAPVARSHDRRAGGSPRPRAPRSARATVSRPRAASAPTPSTTAARRASACRAATASGARSRT